MSEETIIPLYGPADREKITRSIRRVLSVFGIFALIAIAGIVVTLIYRVQWATIAITLVWGALSIFFWGMKLSPLLCYRKHLREIQAGLSHVTQGALVELSRDLTFREGLNFYALTVNIGEQNDPEDDRLFYWDPQKTAPSVAEGDRVALCAHGNDIIGFAKIG